MDAGEQRRATRGAQVAWQQGSRVTAAPSPAAWTQIWFNVIFEVLLAPPVTAFGLLGFAMELNYERVERTLSRDPSPLKRLVHRVGQSLKMLC